MSKPHTTVEYDAKAFIKTAFKAAERRSRHIEILEKYYRKYDRKIKRNERALKKPYVFKTPGFEGAVIPEDFCKLWMRDIISLNARDNVRRTLGTHNERLGQLLSDIEKLKAGLPEDKISPMSRATIYRKWSLGGVGVKELLLQRHGLWY